MVMSKWEEKRLGEVIEVNPSIKLTKGIDYPYIDIDKVSSSNKFVSNVEMKTYKGQSSSKFEQADTVFSRITPCLENRKIAKVKLNGDIKAFGSTEFFVFRGIEGITDNDFVYYLVSSDMIVLPAINSMTGASGRQRADRGFVEKLRIKLPPLQIQERISDILSTYDDLIENNNRRIELLEKASRNLYKEWFVRFRFPNYKQTKFENVLPQGWEIVKLKDYYKTTSGGTPSRKNEKFYINGKYNWIKTGELKDRFIIYTDEKITEEAIKKSSAKLIDKGSLIMAMYGATIGKLGFTIEESTCNQACCVFNTRENDLSNEYLYFWLLTNREYIINISFGAAQQNLSQDLINNINILKPVKYIVGLFDKIIKLNFEEIKVLQLQNQNLIKQRDLLLPRLMSGKLEVE